MVNVKLFYIILKFLLSLVSIIDDKRGIEILTKNCNESIEKVNEPHQTSFPIEQGKVIGFFNAQLTGWEKFGIRQIDTE